MTSSLRITALHVYPIKGCRGVALDQMPVESLGVAGDRRLMLVDGDGRFITQREAPALATIMPILADNALGVSAPGHESLRLHVDPDGPARSVWLWWEHAIIAADQGDIAAEWFSTVLGRRVRLVHFGSQASNPIDPRYSPREGAQTAFTDGYPLMATLQESLDDLNRRLVEPVPMNRFRPSVVVAGAPAWSEDDWSVVRLGTLVCDSVKPCARCIVTATDQLNGARQAAQEPLRTLATFRNRLGFRAVFGQNLVPRSVGMLRTGEEVSVT